MNDDVAVLSTISDQGMVRQANALVKSAQSMELNEKRLIMLAMSRIKWGDEEFLTQDIPVTELAQWIGGNPYQEGRKAADGLLHRVVEILEDGGGQTKFQWTTLSSYIPAHKHKAGVACVRIRFNEELSPFLLQLRDRYNQIPLTHMLPMPSYNSQRLYEILWHDSHAGNKDFLSYEISQLKVFIGLRERQGKWEKYKSWKDFKKVLDKAVDDFNEHGSLKIVNYVGKRQAKRSYSHILFYLRKEDQRPLSTGQSDSALDPQILKLVGELEQLGYTQDPYGTVEAYGIERVQRTLELARDAERKAALTKRPIHNLGGLIASMLKGGVAETRGGATVSKKLANREAEQLARDLTDAYQLALTEHATTLWDGYNESEREEIHNDMRTGLSSKLLDFLESIRWQGRGYTSVRNAYLLDTAQVVLPEDLLDIADFALSQNTFSVLAESERVRVLQRAKSLMAVPENQ